jgi:hypothetical protein
VGIHFALVPHKMRKLLLCMSTVITLAACATTPVKPASSAEAAPRSPDAVVSGANAKILAGEQLYSPMCPAPKFLVDQHCGVEALGPEALSDLYASACAAFSAETCRVNLMKARQTRLQARYPKANAADIQEWCAGDRDECSNLTLLELQWMDSHNEAVLKEFHLTKMDVQLHSKRLYARARREQKEAGKLGRHHAAAEAKELAEKEEAMDSAITAMNH